MKKKVLLYLLIGLVGGVFISQTINIIISLFFINTGVYYPVPPQFSQKIPNEILAAALQYIGSGFIGMAFSAGSLIWQNEKWNYTIQTVLHFLLTSTIMFSVAYFFGWMGNSVGGWAVFVGIFIAIYVIMWFVMRAYFKKQVKEINEKLQ